MEAMQLLHAILHIDQSMEGLIAQYGLLFYLLLFAIVFCETGIVPLFFLPGNPLLFICGAFSSTGTMNLWILLATFISATVSGRTLNYWIGRAIGKRAFTQDYSWLNREALDRTHAFCEKYGGVTMIISPFIAVVRTFAPFVTGISMMNFSKFQLFNILGAIIWVGVLVVGGNLFGNIPLIHNNLNTIVLVGVGTGMVALTIALSWKMVRARRAK
jgi:membrane-associated protein